MKVYKQSEYSHKLRCREIDVTQEQLDKYYAGGLLLQEAFPNLSPTEREFIKSGMTDEEWEELFGSKQ